MKGLKRHFRDLRHYFVPHKGNKHHPGIFRSESVAAIALTLLLIEGAYLLQVKVVLNTGFFASVLPAALATLANADRTQGGLGTLERDALLDRAAQAKADDMAAKGYFA